MIRKVLIANRGEIACRIIRTARSMGIATVAVYSDADAQALHVEMADEAVRIGPAPAAESYLSVAALLDAARRTGADAVHPGYGFLAENAGFARAVTEAGLIFIGPPAEVIERMGSKIDAKRVAQQVGVPVVPGYDGDDQSDERLHAEANAIGYPVMIKASAGGGGKGMREVADAQGMAEALSAARREAKAAFGDDTLLLEKRIVRPRHIEIQIFGDTHGRVLALGERECSIQRRHQKIIEETPSPALDGELRAHMSAAAVALGEAIGYVNAGTVEFIVDAERSFYFLEVNTRLQVEHPVTELRFNEDLVYWQFVIAQGGSLLPLAEMVEFADDGFAVEARLYAEDPAAGFLPTSGDVLRFDMPEVRHVRLDAGIRTGDKVSTFYDPMLAKVIAWGETRLDAIRRLDYALSRLDLLGLRHNAAFLRRVIQEPEYLAGDIDTAFLDRHPDLSAEAPAPPLVLLAAAVAHELMQSSAPPASVSHAASRFRNNPYRAARHTFMLDGAKRTVELARQADGSFRAALDDGSSHEVSVSSYRDGALALVIDGHRQQVSTAHGPDDHAWVRCDAGTYAVQWVDPLPAGRSAVQGESSLRAPMPGNVIAVHVEQGQAVAEGDVLVIMEAMKMEHRIKAPYSGTVSAIHYQAGQFAQFGATLLELERNP